MGNQDLIRVLQTAVSPVVLISGVGLLVLSMTNRFSRTTERARDLLAHRAVAGSAEHTRLDVQIQILYRRSRLLLLSTSLALMSVLLAALLVVALFFAYLAGMNLSSVIIGLFVLSLACLVASLLFFIRDMTLGLRALREELRGVA